MATIPEILSKKWPGRQWRINGDDYATLAWFSAETKPTEAEIRAFSGEVDATIAQERKDEGAQNSLLGEHRDALLRVIEDLTLAINDIQSKLRAVALDAPLTRVASINALITKLQQLRQ